MYSLVEQDLIKSVLQNIRVILTTIKGSDIHRPDFGISLDLLQDKPLTALDKGRIKAEITEAIETYEPRAEVLEVDIIAMDSGATVNLLLDIKGVEVKQNVKLN